MPAAATCPAPAAPPAAGPAPPPAAGAKTPTGPPTPARASASAAATASRTARARARVAAPPAFRARVASHPRPAVLWPPHHRVPARASAQCARTIDLVGTADVTATARHPPGLLPVTCEEAFVVRPALSKFRIRRPLINRANRRYQLCGDGPGAVLSRNTTGVLARRNMEEEADCCLLRL